MSNTSVKPTNRQWIRRLLSGQPHQAIGSPDNPYLLRWYVIPRNPLINVYVHKFCRSDDDRALHDHPWWFVSLMLRGMYVEVTEECRTVRSAPEPWRWFWGDRPLAFRRATWRHRVELVDSWAGPSMPNTYGPPMPCWTLIITGRRSRTWGFWCQTFRYFRNDEGRLKSEKATERFVPWDQFGDAGCGES